MDDISENPSTAVTQPRAPPPHDPTRCLAKPKDGLRRRLSNSARGTTTMAWPADAQRADPRGHARHRTQPYSNRLDMEMITKKTPSKVGVFAGANGEGRPGPGSPAAPRVESFDRPIPFGWSVARKLLATRGQLRRGQILVLPGPPTPIPFWHRSASGDAPPTNVHRTAS